MQIEKLIFFGAIILIILLVKYFYKGKNYDEFKDTTRPAESLKPKDRVENDKLIFVSNVKKEEIEQVLTEFCNAYNRKNYAVIAELGQLGTNRFQIRFPYDIEFVIFGFLVNYLYFPMNVEYQPQIDAWGSFRETDDSVKEEFANQLMCFFIPKDTKDYTCVYLVSPKHKFYKFNFGKSGNPVEPAKGVHRYKEMPSVSLPTETMLIS